VDTVRQKSRNPLFARVMGPVLERLAELQALEADWDTYGALPLTPTALGRADTIMRAVLDLYGDTFGDRIAPYTVMPIVDGGVALEWRGSKADFNLDIGPTGDLSYLLIERGADGRTFEEKYDVSDQHALDLVRRVVGG
jgi:hypothetical protein